MKNKYKGINTMITATQAAIDHITKMLTNRGKGIGIRLGMKKTGCSGMAYQLEYVDTPNEEDTIFQLKMVNLYIDPKSLPFLDGTELDYTREGLEEGFKFNNPNVKDQCGCGESVRV